MKTFLFALMLLTGSVCFGQSGAVNGNVFWKYNDFMGNKPDAGAKVLLFSTDTTKDPFETLCDLSGNFKFENIDPGKYLLVVISKNTNSTAEDRFNAMNWAPMKDYLGYNIKDINPALYDTLGNLKRDFTELDFKVGTGKNKKENKQIEKDALAAYSRYQQYLNKYLLGVPFSIRTMAMTTGIKKLSVQEVKIENDKSKNVVVDFGLTSF